MAKKEDSIRHFSTAFKQEKVRMFEEKKITVREISELYSVSRAAVYKWIRKYGKLPRTERLVIEKESEEVKTMELLKRIRDLEAALGRKDIENTYLKEVIKQASAHLGYDLEKKSKSR